MGKRKKKPKAKRLKRRTRMARSKQSLLEESERLKSAVDSGKFKTKASRHAAQLQVYRLRHRAKLAGQPKTPKAQPVAKDQGYLPGFLSGLDHVRIEELIAEKIFKKFVEKVEESIERKIEQMFKVG